MGEEGKSSEIHFSTSDAASGWPEPVRVDGSTAAPVWAAVDVDGSKVWVTWRDNRRGGPYRVYLRRSNDGGKTWLAEQEITHEVSGDPSVCSAGDGSVWPAHHGKGKITVRFSADGGATFGEPQVIGDGWFARVSCDDDGRVVAGWEQSVGQSPKDSEKKSAAYAFGNGGKVGAVNILSDTAGTTASVTMRPDGKADAVWIDRANAPESAGPTSGELWHEAVG